jgi:undecaprenyl-diphosphatase
MNIVQAVIMGFVQGLSEFLPISYSAHIVFVSALYKIATGQSLAQGVGGEEIFFDIIIHLATLFAVLLFFKSDIIEIIKGFFKALKEKDYKNDNFVIVSMLLVVTGFVLFFSEKFKQKNDKNNLKTSILIGLAQGLAVFPGLSRSGLTIATGIFKGLDRVQAAKFSFLLSVPIIFLASLIYPIMELDFKEIAGFNFTAIVIGALVAFVSGYFCIKYFMRLLSSSNLRIFAYYCWAVGFLGVLLFGLFHHL